MWRLCRCRKAAREANERHKHHPPFREQWGRIRPKNRNGLLCLGSGSGSPALQRSVLGSPCKLKKT
jgi:hypothetical protein